MWGCYLCLKDFTPNQSHVAKVLGTFCCNGSHILTIHRGLWPLWPQTGNYTCGHHGNCTMKQRIQNHNCAHHGSCTLRLLWLYTQSNTLSGPAGCAIGPKTPCVYGSNEKWGLLSPKIPRGMFSTKILQEYALNMGGKILVYQRTIIKCKRWWYTFNRSKFPNVLKIDYKKIEKLGNFFSSKFCPKADNWQMNGSHFPTKLIMYEWTLKIPSGTFPPKPKATPGQNLLWMSI